MHANLVMCVREGCRTISDTLTQSHYPKSANGRFGSGIAARPTNPFTARPFTPRAFPSALRVATVRMQGVALSLRQTTLQMRGLAGKLGDVVLHLRGPIL